MDEIESRRRSRRETGVRRTTVRLPQKAEPPGWVSRFVIPRDACEACARHWHHRCWGVNLAIPDEERPDCPCDCGDRRDPMRLSPEAWADLSLYAPDRVWIAAMFERQRAGGIHMCVTNDEGRMQAWKETRHA